MGCNGWRLWLAPTIGIVNNFYLFFNFFPQNTGYSIRLVRYLPLHLTGNIKSLLNELLTPS
jgi:hypothetical protein